VPWSDAARRDNYFGAGHRTQLPPKQPVLNVISLTDRFSRVPTPGSAIRRHRARGRARAAQERHRRADGGGPHTLLMLPAARYATAGFLMDSFKP
jgi:hypothetical protein